MPDWWPQHEVVRAFGPSHEKLVQYRNEGKLPWKRCGHNILVDVEVLQKLQREKADEYLVGGQRP